MFYSFVMSMTKNHIYAENWTEPLSLYYFLHEKKKKMFCCCCVTVDANNAQSIVVLLCVCVCGILLCDMSMICKKKVHRTQEFGTSNTYMWKGVPIMDRWLSWKKRDERNLLFIRTQKSCNKCKSRFLSTYNFSCLSYF